MSEPLKVHKMSHVMPVSVTGTDEQGRTTAICPHCSDEGYFAEGGRFVCPTWEPVSDFLTKVLGDLTDPGAGYPMMPWRSEESA